MLTLDGLTIDSWMSVDGGECDIVFCRDARTECVWFFKPRNGNEYIK